MEFNTEMTQLPYTQKQGHCSELLAQERENEIGGLEQTVASLLQLYQVLPHEGPPNLSIYSSQAALLGRIEPFRTVMGPSPCSGPGSLGLAMTPLHKTFLSRCHVLISKPLLKQSKLHVIEGMFPIAALT